jgi:hypothetical protein
MIAPHCNNGSRRREISPGTKKSKPQWVRVPKIGHIPAATNSQRKRIFAIVSRPIPTVIESKTMRRVVVFDNHPDSLRLILQAGVDAADDDFFAVRRDKLISFVCGSVLVAMCVAALLWASWPQSHHRPLRALIRAHRKVYLESERQRLSLGSTVKCYGRAVVTKVSCDDVWV